MNRELLLVHQVVITLFAPARKDFCLLYVFASSLRGHDVHWVSSLRGAESRSKALSWSTRLCPSGGQRGVCAPVFPKDALELKFQPCNFISHGVFPPTEVNENRISPDNNNYFPMVEMGTVGKYSCNKDCNAWRSQYFWLLGECFSP